MGKPKVPRTPVNVASSCTFGGRLGARKVAKCLSKVLFRYHFGSMVKASLYISAVRPLRGLFGSLAAVAL